MTEDVTSAARRRRVQRLKKIILLVLITFLLIPTVLCIILFARMRSMQRQIEELREKVETQQDSAMSVSTDTIPVQEAAVTTESVQNTYTTGSTQAEEAELLTEAGRKIYLTFDDGPSKYTNDILDILKQYDVKATFFVTGKTDEASKEAYIRIVEEGHTLGMHSYSHRYEEIYQSVNAYAEDLGKLQEFLYETTGVWSRYVRFPGGSSNRVSRVDMQELIQYLDEQGIQYFDWNVSSQDAAKGYVSAERIVENVMKDAERYDTAIVLMHDAADKETTVEALPILIEKLQALENTSLVAIDDETVPVQHRKLTE